MTELTTDRLELRQWREDDLDDYAAIIADPEVGRFIGGAQDRATAWRQIAIFLRHRQLRGWTSSAVVKRESGQLIGRGGLWYSHSWPDVEVQWILDRSTWGHGYATEIGQAVRDYAFDQIGVTHLISLIQPDNAASIHVAEKIGATLEGQFDVNGAEHMIYGQSAARRQPRARC